jgi:hypothetical protein
MWDENIAGQDTSDTQADMYFTHPLYAATQMSVHNLKIINPLMLELNPSAQRCLTRIFYWGFFFLNHALR